jgi:hypothetical protein
MDWQMSHYWVRQFINTGAAAMTSAEELQAGHLPALLDRSSVG